MSEINHSGSAIKSEEVDRKKTIPPQKSTTAFKCEFCAQEFQLKDRLIQHVLKSHELSLNIIKSEENPTSQMSSQSSTTPQHVECTLPKFTCSVCQKSFKYKSVLTSHKLVHSDSRPFQCSLCEKSFKS
eukprot:164002_1